jgi:hypothetical protein
MAFKTRSNPPDSPVGVGIAALVLAHLVLTVSCSPTLPDSTHTTATDSAPTPASGWSELQQRTPYPYSTPLPSPDATVLDGTYVKFDLRYDDRAPCRRCPPYPPEGGLWRLSLDKGIFRVYHEISGWRTVGSFAVREDRIWLFNDPHCNQDTGIYTWKLEEGELTLTILRDDCAYDLRARHFTELGWQSCQPPSTEAAITNHWAAPVGCDMTMISQE